MSKLAILSAAAATTAIVLLSSVAAEAYVATGTIAILDTKNHDIKLNNGRTYILPAKISLTPLHMGDRVRVTYSYSLIKRTRTASKVVLVAATTSTKTGATTKTTS